MPIINQRWPRELAPETCVFGRSRNDVAQESPRTRQRTFVRQGRPLWSAELTWSLPNTDILAKLRYWLDALEGFTGAVQVWDFASYRPDGADDNERIYWTWSGASMPWTVGGLPSWWALDSTLSTSATAASGATSISLSGLPANAVIALQGQYVQIGRRLYLVAATVVASGLGAATVTLTTPLLSAAPTGTTVRFVEAACEMELVEQSYGFSARAGDGLVSVSARFRETVVDKN